MRKYRSVVLVTQFVAIRAAALRNENTHRHSAEAQECRRNPAAAESKEPVVRTEMSTTGPEEASREERLDVANKIPPRRAVVHAQLSSEMSGQCQLLQSHHPELHAGNMGTETRAGRVWGGGQNCCVPGQPHYAVVCPPEQGQLTVPQCPLQLTMIFGVF